MSAKSQTNWPTARLIKILIQKLLTFSTYSFKHKVRSFLWDSWKPLKMSLLGWSIQLNLLTNQKMIHTVDSDHGNCAVCYGYENMLWPQFVLLHLIPCYMWVAWYHLQHLIQCWIYLHISMQHAKRTAHYHRCVGLTLENTV